MRVLMVVALLVGAAFMVLFVLADLARNLSRHSFQAPPDLDSSDDWDIEVDEFAGAARPMVSQYRIPRTLGDHLSDDSNALDDLRSAL
jgi:hypothetical protein